MIDRFLFVQALDTVRCLEEGVLESVVDANVGSIFGIGFAALDGRCSTIPESIWFSQSRDPCQST